MFSDFRDNHTFSCVLLGILYTKVSFRPAIFGCTYEFYVLGYICSKLIRPSAYLHIVLPAHGISVCHQRFYSYFSALFLSLLYSVLISYFTRFQNVHMVITLSKKIIFDPGLFCALRYCLGMVFSGIEKN